MVDFSFGENHLGQASKDKPAVAPLALLKIHRLKLGQDFHVPGCGAKHAWHVIPPVKDCTQNAGFLYLSDACPRGAKAKWILH